MDYSIIENGVVINRIVADLEFMQGLGVEFTDDPAAQIGCVLVDGEWVRPSDEETV